MSTSLQKGSKMMSKKEGHKASHPSAPPAWAAQVFDGPDRFKDLAAIRARIKSDPTLLTARIVPAIESAARDAKADDQKNRKKWEINALRTMVYCCLLSSPGVTRNEADATATIAQRTAEVGQAADALLQALRRLKGAGDLALANGIDPVLLPTGIDFHLVAPELPTILRTVSTKAKQWSRPPSRPARHAGAARIIERLDAELECRLPHVAMVDCLKLILDIDVTSAAVAKARIDRRTVRD